MRYRKVISGASTVYGIVLMIFGIIFFTTAMSFNAMTPKNVVEDMLEEGVDEDVAIMIQDEMDASGFFSSSGFEIFNIVSYGFMAIGAIITIVGLVLVIKSIRNKSKQNDYKSTMDMNNSYVGEQGGYNQNNTYNLNGITYNINGEKVDN